jgi:putative endonuclease
MTSRQEIGRWGENVAAEYLKNRGYKILGRNIRTPYGELDLITQTSSVTVFVEVKTRTGESYGLPEQSVDEKKQAHILNSARYYLQQNLGFEGDWRVDVIAIQGRPDQPGVQIEWFENAIT